MPQGQVNDINQSNRRRNVFIKPNDQRELARFGMARPDERSMSRVEFTPTMPCKEEEDKVKTAVSKKRRYIGTETYGR